MTVGERIKQRRMELGLSQEEVALKAGYKSRSSVNKLEGSRNLPLSKVEKMAAALECSPSYLMGWLDEAPFTAMSKTSDVIAAHKATGTPIKDLIGVNYEITEEDCKNTTRVFEIKKNADERLGFISNLTDKDKTTSISLADHIFVQMCKDLISENKIGQLINMKSETSKDRAATRRAIVELLAKEHLTDALYFGKDEYTSDELTKINEYASFLKTQRKPLLNAAQQRTDIEAQKGIDTSDNDIMDDENF